MRPSDSLGKQSGGGVTLREFRELLQSVMDAPDLRPFVCDGSPLKAKIFIVGFNPATSMDQPFWNYWSDDTGFDKQQFMRDYLVKRELKSPRGVRGRIEQIVSQLPRGAAVETNICSKPTETAAELRRDQRTTRVFRLLLETIKPKIVYVHSDEPIEYFEDLTGQSGFASGSSVRATYGEQQFLLLATRGPLYRMGYPAARNLGQNLLALMKSISE